MSLIFAATMLSSLAFVGAQQSTQQQAPQTDQTVPVQRGARLVVNDFAGEIIVRAWDKDAVRVQAEHSSRERIDIKASDTVVNVRPHSSLGPPRSMDIQITVPSWMRLDLSGTYTDVTVDGVQAEITVETVRGDVKVKGGSGFVSLKSVEGLVSVEGAKGRVNVRSVNEGVHLADIAGDIMAETVNGGITLERIQSVSVDVATVNGDLAYDGTVQNSGVYRLTTHNGDITMTVPESANATVSVRTFNGDFVSAFPVNVEDNPRRNKRFNFTLGSGSARIDLESFGGTIRLRRPAGAARKE